MSINVYLTEGLPGDPGQIAWVLDLHGCATWAATEAEVLAKVPTKVQQYVDWLRRHGEHVDTLVGPLVVRERLVGDEVLYVPDLAAAEPAEIDRTIRVLAHSRQDLLALLDEVPHEAWDWVPSYKRYPAWATWRTIEQVVGHVARTEVDYYLRWIGYDGPRISLDARGDRTMLAESRACVLRFLDDLQQASDRSRVTEARGERWSVRKALRRMVWHELLHIKNIRRILRDFHTREVR